MKRFIFTIAIVAITVMAFTACTKKSEAQQQTATAEQTQTGGASEQAPANDDAYSSEGEAPAASQSLLWEPADLTGEWHSAEITGSCHGQPHFIFTADGYYKKGDLFPKHDGTWSLARDGAGKYNLMFQYKEFIDFESGWTSDDIIEYGEYETYDPNNISMLLHGTGWIELTRCNNPGWSAQ